MAKGWYAVHTYSGYEQKIERLIHGLMETSMDFSMFCLDVKVPFETLVETRDGVKKEVKRKVLPGYILVQLDMPEDETWKKYCDQIRRIQGVTGFLTATRASRPLPLSKDEMDNILMKTGELQAEKAFRPKQSYTEGETVRITDGPFSGFNGVIEEINHEKSRMRVTVEIFGRPTPVDIDFTQVEKI